MSYEPGDDLDWIRSREKKYIGKNNGKYFLVKGKKVRGIFPFIDEALEKGGKKYGKEKFLVYHMVKDLYIDNICDKNKALIAGISDLSSIK